MTIDECFKAARELFIKNNSQLVEHIQREATKHAHNIGLSEEKFCEMEINKHFGKYLASLGNDTTISAIQLMAPNEASRKELLLEYYRTLAKNLGISVDEYFALNSMSAADL